MHFTSSFHLARALNNSKCTRERERERDRERERERERRENNNVVIER